ncbi:predicted protein [Streptomyces sp. C]|nr:predicted protein [Streptomyces sp. C]
MYGWIWGASCRGNAWVRALISLVLVLGGGGPCCSSTCSRGPEALLPFNDVTGDEGSGATP